MGHSGNTYIYTDGACQGNGKENAVGGWGFVCDRYDDKNHCRRVIEQNGGEVGTTNNRMELTALLKALEFFYKTMDIFEALYIFSDSKYIVRCMTEKWYKTWERNGWKNSKKEPVANQDLWEMILFYIREIGENTIEFKWIKGHSGIPYNEQADKLAVAGLEKVKKLEKEKKDNE